MTTPLSFYCPGPLQKEQMMWSVVVVEQLEYLFLACLMLCLNFRGADVQRIKLESARFTNIMIPTDSPDFNDSPGFYFRISLGKRRCRSVNYPSEINYQGHRIIYLAISIQSTDDDIVMSSWHWRKTLPNVSANSLFRNKVWLHNYRPSRNFKGYRVSIIRYLVSTHLQPRLSYTNRSLSL